jgi:hypothetical protein
MLARILVLLSIRMWMCDDAALILSPGMGGRLLLIVLCKIFFFFFWL